MSDNEGSGIGWRELLTDKSIDIVLIPLGLFAALWFQGWVDDRKAEDDYVALLESFRTEIAANRDKGHAMDSQIGPNQEREPGKAMGPLGKIFGPYSDELGESIDLVECLGFVLTPPKEMSQADLDELAKTPEGREQIKADMARGEEDMKESERCQKMIADVGKDPKPDIIFEVVDLSPLYRYEVWQIYLQDGIKLFDDESSRAIGRKLGEAYAVAHEVEQRVAEIEDDYNNEMLRRIGAMDEVQAELAVLLDSRHLEEAGPRLSQLGSEMRRALYSLSSVRSMLDTKVSRVKSFVEDMTRRFDDLDKALADEIAAKQ